MVRDAAVALALVALGDAHRQDRLAAERARHVGDVGQRQRAVAPRAARADEPGPDRGDHRFVAPRPPRERRRDARALTSPSRHGAAATATSTSPRAFSARTASDSETGSAPPATCTYATRVPREPGGDRRDLAVHGAEHDRHAVEASRRARPSPRRTAPPPAPACTAASSRARPARAPGRGRASGSRRARRSRPSRARARAPACSRAPRRRARPGRSGAGRRRTARRRPRAGRAPRARSTIAVTAPRRRPISPRAASTSASVTSTIASRSATAMCSSDEWIAAMPLPRFRHSRPRSLKTFASAPPPGQHEVRLAADAAERLDGDPHGRVGLAEAVAREVLLDVRLDVAVGRATRRRSSSRASRGAGR